METNKLMKGNYFLSYGVDLHQIKELKENRILINFHPIPLTEDWLNKMHAVYKEKNQYEIDRFLLIWKPGYKYWYVVDSFSKTYLTKVEFVHEFQNMYFILNGEELELTIKD